MQALEKNNQNKLVSCEKFDLKKKMNEIGDIHEKRHQSPVGDLVHQPLSGCITKLLQNTFDRTRVNFRCLVAMGFMGLAEPIKFERRVLEPFSF